MQFKYEIGTKIFFGKSCLLESAKELTGYGKKAMIVTGPKSGKSSGALADTISVLTSAGIEYFIFSDIQNNPDLENINTAGKAAKSFKPDFIIGIGGGSPLDASKAVAVLAVNEIEPVELFKNVFNNTPLPIIAIPTTAGTGSEVTPYSILTRRDINTKMSFGNVDTFPKVAFMDPRYTESLSPEATVNTAVDALSHAIEGYLSRRSTPISDIYAVEAINIFGECIESLVKNNFNFELREKLLYVAMLGGMVIAHTGTTIVHGMGYSLTYFKDIPHGRANGILMKEYLKYNYDHAKEKIENILKALKMKDIFEFGNIMDLLINNDLKLTEVELELYASLAIKQKSASYNIREVTEKDMVQIMKNSTK
jgi:alcohol dehydrogenase class IV